MEEGSGSVFQTKYDEFIDDLLGAVPEYTNEITSAKALTADERLKRFYDEVKVEGASEDTSKNPGKILPGVEITDTVWNTLSENTHKAIWEHIRVLSICCFMEAGFKDGGKPEWMDDIMNQMKDKLSGVDFEGVFKKFMHFFKPDTTDSADAANGASSSLPKIPEKFLKGHLAKLAEELVRDIKPEDLGMSPELVEECEKSPSRAFDILLQLFTKNPGIIQSTVQKIGRRLQQKIQSGAIRPQEIAREAEELMKEFTSDSSFTDLMETLKSTFGFEDMGIARAAGREGSARLAAVKERLKKKANKKKTAGSK